MEKSQSQSSKGVTSADSLGEIEVGDLIEWTGYSTEIRRGVVLQVRPETYEIEIYWFDRKKSILTNLRSEYLRKVE
tara:strand:+ start:18895 stop:19122 length:228 start_codon:yes stop_codon:yes gene_type:complete